jgi:ABC-2 type transport system permease protein
MKTASVIVRSLKEQLRSYWILLLSLSMGPFFILVYYLILETSKPQYDLLVVNSDTGVSVEGKSINHGDELTEFLKKSFPGQSATPFKVIEASRRDKSVEKVRNRDADALIIIDSLFSQSLEKQKTGNSSTPSKVEFIGDITSTNYLITAVWANEIVNEYALNATNGRRIIEVSEIALGSSARIDEFDMIVPGILILSLIMLMFTASIAFVSEVENRTILRLKLSKISAFEYLSGISIVQLIVGIISLLLTLFTAIMLGFQYTGSLMIMIFIGSLTSLSIISFSLIIAALTRSAGEVLVVGNFPMFLFMFFTGAAFPLKSDALFTVAGYPVNIQGLMSPTHAISALNKTLVMNMDFKSIVPEIISIVVLTILYFVIGAIIFKRRHLKLT